MPAMQPPNAASEPPPSYEQVTGGSSAASSSRPNQRARNGLTVEARRSMEDEGRPLPKGWLRQFDAQYKHHFYVDTAKEPPRSIWHHPYDDEEYLGTLSSEERERIQQESLLKVPTSPDMRAESTDEERDTVDAKHGKADSKRPATQSSVAGTAGSSSEATSSAGASSVAQGKKPKSFGEKMKDKLTGTTHDQRVQERIRREREEQEVYAAHMHYRNAMARAYDTGQPQYLGRDRDGKEVFVEPPYGAGGHRSVPSGASYANPYTQGPYANPNARFIRPPGPYGRPGYGGYGGGMGLPLAAGVGGGLLLGGLLF